MFSYWCNQKKATGQLQLWFPRPLPPDVMNSLRPKPNSSAICHPPGGRGFVSLDKSKVALKRISQSGFWILIRNLADFFKPSRGLTIAGRPVISSWRQGTSGTDLWRIGYATAFELTQLEKAQGENREPTLDFREGVLMSSCFGDIGPLS
jgi:hypothetical protein